MVYPNGYVAGISDWTSWVATTEDIERWSDDSRLGICLQTRRIRALDCDITDPILAAVIWLAISNWFKSKDRLKLDPPFRIRKDSSKFLVLFEIGDGEEPTEYGKRVMKTKGGALEFLANGQQCLVAGTHKDGARYEWALGLPMEVQLITPDEFEELWGILEMTYATEEPTVSRVNRKRSTGDVSSYNDPVADYLRGLQ